MSFSLGIIGLPNVGKSTLFNVLSKAGAEVSNYPFCTINPNVGVVAVPDERLEKVQKIMGAKKAIPTVIEFYDIAGLVKGASKGEGLGNKFLANIRDVDAIVHVVRCFESSNIAHVSGKVDPKADIEIIQTELILADLATVEKRLEKTKVASKSGDKKILAELKLLDNYKNRLSAGASIENEIVDLDLLTTKPVFYVANVDETGNADKVNVIKDVAGQQVVPICAQLEAEIADLSPEEAKEYMKEVGLQESGLQRLIHSGYQLLNLITFFTANQKECRAWTVEKGIKIPQAAGKVHSDMERGFIAADVVHYNDLITAGSYSKTREKGTLHSEGKNYIVVDGDLVLIKFS